MIFVTFFTVVLLDASFAQPQEEGLQGLLPRPQRDLEDLQSRLEVFEQAIAQLRQMAWEETKFEITETTIEGTSVVLVGTVTTHLPTLVEWELIEVDLVSDVTVPTPVSKEANADTWSATFKDLPNDRFYFPYISLSLAGGSAEKFIKERITVGAPSAVFAELATLQQHREEGRITAQTLPCSNWGFGVCDKGITALSAEHGDDHFPLFAADRGGPWYANSDAIPTTPRAPVDERNGLPSAATENSDAIPTTPPAEVDGRGGLPSAATENALRVLSARLEITEAPMPGPLLNLLIDLERLPVSARNKFALSEDNSRAIVPIAEEDGLIVQFEPNVSAEEIDAFLQERDLEVKWIYPPLGAMLVKTDLDNFVHSKSGDDWSIDVSLRRLVDAVRFFEEDPRIRSATPNLLLRRQNNDLPPPPEGEIANLLTPTDVILSKPDPAAESVDWGIEDIQADQVWGEAGAQDGALLGVIDVGFARHEDIVFLEAPADVNVQNHGNHVAAIACGLHNGRGVRGVIPNCFVRVCSSKFFHESKEGSKELQLLVYFSQILGEAQRFIEATDDVHTFNVSLGYNWMSYIQTNPDDPKNSNTRALVESQGVQLVTLLALAKKQGKVIFSAAGNDSTGLTEPISAKYASPFNWAAIAAREQGIAMNGVIIEAHGQDGKRASFSNVDGHLSCPGVDILSAVAYGPSGVVATNAYGKLSGTSMASPYCAAGHALFRLVRPEYDGVEALECMMQSAERSDTGAPMLRLSKALEVCPARHN